MKPPQHRTMKRCLALLYGDGNLSRVPVGMQTDLTRWAQAVDLSKVPILHPRSGLSPGGLER